MLCASLGKILKLMESQKLHETLTFLRIKSPLKTALKVQLTMILVKPTKQTFPNWNCPSITTKSMCSCLKALMSPRILQQTMTLWMKKNLMMMNMLKVKMMI
uniref:Uncharacterized protein n=1 Tax=Cacopsylla melanoneura TaxID=428564 RepID=A0A8D8ZWA4_9HEMI